MSKFRPSRYISHSDYATVKTYQTITATLTIPNSVTVSSSDTVYDVDLSLPTGKGLGWRSIVTNTTNDFGIHTPSFLIPCSLTISGTTFDTFIYGEVYRNSSSSIRFRIVFTGISGGATYSGMGDTYTIKLQPIISPFEA